MTRKSGTRISIVIAALGALALVATTHAAEPEGGAAVQKNPTVTIKTSMGDITAELYADKAPITVKNFIDYAKAGYYDGTVFHRVIPGFMIQGGGMTADLSPKPGTKAPIKNEATNGLKNQDGTLAMARTGVVDSATSQFFINVKDNAFLDHKSATPQGFGYAVFGKVTGGMDVVRKIEGVATGSKGMHQDVPKSAVTIEKVTVAE
ncbi:MAG: peptidyl-prolyl cis-trans isomerase [Deltaproteobacteria bacterium]|nr:peptidyl-prolyl cis-trans isomerase [Deltaproteobacteria bacterium]